MQKVRVISRKYDGSLRDEYETYLWAETDETIQLFSLPGLPYWHGRLQAWHVASDGLLAVFPKNRWYNVFHITEQVSNTNLMYVNIAMPAVLREGVLEWTDLDLDYRVHLDGSAERLDQDEFEENAQRMGYPDEMVAQVHAACREVETGLAQGVFPFDHAQQVELYHQLKRERHFD